MKTQRVCLLHMVMLSGGVFYSKANFCLMSQEEIQQKAAWMNSGAQAAEGPGPHPHTAVSPAFAFVI